MHLHSLRVVIPRNVTREDARHLTQFVRSLPHSIRHITFVFPHCSRIYNYISAAWQSCTKSLGNLPHLEDVGLRMGCRLCIGARSLRREMDRPELDHGMFPYNQLVVFTDVFLVAVSCVDNSDALQREW